jgi:hypothetical protein
LADKLDQLFALMGGTLDAATAEKLRAELRDPSSVAARLLEAIREVARAEIDLARIPGMEEIARFETRMEGAGEKPQGERSA